MGNDISTNKPRQIIKKKIKKPISRNETNETYEYFFPKENEIIYNQNLSNNVPPQKQLNQSVLNNPPQKSEIIYNRQVNQNNEMTPYIHTTNIQLRPDNLENEISSFQDNLKREKEEFEKEQKRREIEFEREQNKKYEYLKKELSKFENEYNPYQIMGIDKESISESILKKKYKTLILKYHPDKVGDKYKDQFQIITQAYLYLLNVIEKENELSEKTKKKVNIEYYEDKIHEIQDEGVENIHVDKDNFNINTFNKIFEKYRLPSEYDNGYNDLDFKEPKEENVLFGKKFNQEIFHSHFDKLKTKHSSDIIEYQEPKEIYSSGNFGFQELGITNMNDFGSINSTQGLSYTDYKKAHLDENLLIDAQKVKYKSYKNMDHLEQERSNISYQPTQEDKKKYALLQQKKEEDERIRYEYMLKQDEKIKNQYEILNKKLIVHH